MKIALGLFGMFMLVVANGFFVAVEFALVTVDRTKIDASAQEGSRRARAAKLALERLSFHLSGAQLGITVSSLVVGALARPVIGPLLDPVVEPLIGRPNSGLTIVLSLMLAIMFQVVVGELMPKAIAIAHPEATSLTLAPAARVIHGLASPAISLFNGVANWAVRRMGIEPQEELSGGRSMDDIAFLIRSSGERGTIAPEALNLLQRTLRFGEKTAADALVPRVHVAGLAQSAVVGDLVDQAIVTGHSRYPVYEDDLDDIIGVVGISEVFKLDPQDRQTTPIADLLQEPHVIPETRDLVDILDDFRLGDQRMFVVIDEHGGTAGILTLEDVLEEITGDIDDEFDDDTNLDLTLGATPGVIIVSGTLHSDEVEEASGFIFPDGQYETVAGFVLEQMGRIPAEGDSLAIDGWHLEVVAMDRLRIASVQISQVGSSQVDPSQTSDGGTP